MKIKLKNSIYLISNRKTIPEKGFIKLIEKAIKGGISYLELREEHISTRDFLILAKKIKLICDKYNIKFIINDRYDVALIIDADGFFIEKSKLTVETARALFGKDKLIGKLVKKNDNPKLFNNKEIDFLRTNLDIDEVIKKQENIFTIKKINDIKKNTKAAVFASGYEKDSLLDELNKIEHSKVAIASDVFNLENVERKIKKIKRKLETLS